MLFTLIKEWKKAGVYYFFYCLLSACAGGNDQGSSLLTNTSFDNSTSELTTLNIPIFYVKRVIPSEVQDIEAPYAFNPGAQLYMRATSSALSPEVNITASIHGDNLNYDVKDLAISPDGKRLVFAMHAPEPDPDNPVNGWEIWEYIIETNNLHRVVSPSSLTETFKNHDFSPEYIYSPNDNNDDNVIIVFSSTRLGSKAQIRLINEGKGNFNSLEEDSAITTTTRQEGNAIYTSNLFIYDGSSDISRQITFNASHDLNPLPLPSGDILFTRWDNIKTGNNDAFSLYKTTQYGEQTELQYGYHSHKIHGSDNDEAIIGKLKLVPNESDNKVMGILHQRSMDGFIYGGAIVTLDWENYVDDNQPTAPNTGVPGNGLNYISRNDVKTNQTLSLGGRFSSVTPLNDGSGRLLVSYSSCIFSTDLIDFIFCSSSTNPVNQFTRYGLWIYQPGINGSNDLLQPIDTGELFYMYTDVVIAETSTSPLVISSGSSNPNLANDDLAILNIRSINDFDGTEQTTFSAARFLRLVKSVPIPDDEVEAFGNNMIGINRTQLMREIVGYLPVEPDGSVRGIVPANVPLMISVVDDTGKRISVRHNHWISLSSNETFECKGCHSSSSTLPHGRYDAQPASTNIGASNSNTYPGTAITACSPGDTMAETRTTPNCSPITEQLPNADLAYDDIWTSIPFTTIDYTNTPVSPQNSFCSPWQALCRIIINYETHIQPIWEATRTAVDDGSGNMIDSCTGCHTTNGGTRVPAAQLDLTSTPSVITSDHLTSYRELLASSSHLTLNNGVLVTREEQCPSTDIDGNPITIINTFSNIGRVMDTSGANSSPDFFDCLTQDNACDDNVIPTSIGCTESSTDPVLNEPVINHNSLLSESELRLIAEWLDLGAQYYNNPSDIPN